MPNVTHAPNDKALTCMPMDVRNRLYVPMLLLDIDKAIHKGQSSGVSLVHTTMHVLISSSDLHEYQY